MAKKYRAVENKISWITWTAMGVVVALIVALLIALQPSAKTIFYDSYYDVRTDTTFEQKLPRVNKFILINRFEDGFLGFNKGLFTAGSHADEVAIVYFGAPSLETGAATLANVYARLYGSEKTDPVIQPSNLYTELSDALKLYYFEHNGTDFNKVITRLNEKYEDAALPTTAAVPFVLVLLNNEVVSYAVLTDANIPLQLFNFYNDVLETEAIQSLL